MAKQVSLYDKLVTRLTKLGTSQRKAKELAKDIAPAVQRQSKVSVTERLETKLMKLGLSERKATELAKGLAPTVRTALKAKQTAKAAKLTHKDVEDEVEKHVDAAEDAELDKVAPRVNGHRVRLDLPVADWRGQKGLELLRVMDGYSTKGTYLSVALKGDQGIVACRYFGENSYKLKFYPNFAYWNFTKEQLESLGATQYLNRGPYERHFYSKADMEQVMARVQAEAKSKSRVKALLDRMLAVPGGVVVGALKVLRTKRAIAA